MINLTFLHLWLKILLDLTIFYVYYEHIKQQTEGINMTYEQWLKKRKEQQMIKTVLNFLGWCVAVITIMALCTVALCKALNTPEVEISYSTKQCVRVVYMDGTITDCSKLPEKYDRVWVK